MNLLMYNQLSLESNKTEPKIAKCFRSTHEVIGFVMMAPYRMNWPVLHPVFVDYVQTEDMLWNLRMDDDG